MIRLPEEGVVFPLKEAYRRDNYTLEGRQAYLGVKPFDPAEEPGPEPGYDAPDSGGLTKPSGGETTGLGRWGPSGFKYDTLGRKYAVDDYGKRWSAKEGRPAYFP